MTTIRDVAARAGVSVATVSRVLNGHRVSPEKTKAVHRAAAQLSYSPNRAAQALRTQTSRVIALIVADIENPFFTALARGVADTAQASGYSVVLCNSDEIPEREMQYLEIAASEHMAGAILVPAHPDSDVSALLDRGTPVVSVDRTLARFPVDAVVVDNRAGGHDGAGHLFRRGFRRVACITGPRSAETALQRSAGWLAAVAEHAPDLEPADYLRYSDYRVGGGRQAMAELLDQPSPPDSVFVANNLMTVGVLDELTARGSGPPEFGVVSFGDLPHLSLAARGVTVIPLPARQIGECAASLLLERIGGGTSPTRTVVLRNDAGT